MEAAGYLVKRVLFLAVSILALVPVVSFAYDDDTTHRGLTAETVRHFRRLYPEYSITYLEEEALIQGVYDEDAEGRFFQHFYDPVYERGLTIVGYSWQSAREWLASDELLSWQDAIEGYSADKISALLRVGHILHLLQDMTVPDHTRNDPHPPVFYEGSPYELYAQQYDMNLVGVPEERVTRIPSLGDPDRYLAERAVITSHRFFSQDTVFSKNYEYPVSLYVQSEKNTLGTEDLFVYGRGTAGNLHRLGRIIKFFDFSGNEVGVRYTLFDHDHKIMADYWRELSPEAVRYGVGLLKTFFEQASGVTVDSNERSDFVAALVSSVLSGNSPPQGVSALLTTEGTAPLFDDTVPSVASLDTISIDQNMVMASSSPPIEILATTTTPSPYVPGFGGGSAPALVASPGGGEVANPVVEEQPESDGDGASPPGSDGSEEPTDDIDQDVAEEDGSNSEIPAEDPPDITNCEENSFLLADLALLFADRDIVEVIPACSGAYVMNSSLSIPQNKTMHMGPGVVIKFGYQDDLIVSGKLLVDGTESEPVVLTSIFDDSHGGDSLLDGACDILAGNCPQFGYWGYVTFLGDQPSVLRHLRVLYAGAGSANQDYAIAAYNTTISFDGLILSHAYGHGMYEQESEVLIENSRIEHTGDEPGGALHYAVGMGVGSVRIENSILSDNDIGIEQNGNLHLSGVGFFNHRLHPLSVLPGLGDVSLSGVYGGNNRRNAIIIENSIDDRRQVFLGPNPFPYLIDDSPLEVNPRAALHFLAGSVIKIGPTGFGISGELYFDGAENNPVEIRSMYDDRDGTDVTNDGENPAIMCTAGPPIRLFGSGQVFSNFTAFRVPPNISENQFTEFNNSTVVPCP